MTAFHLHHPSVQRKDRMSPDTRIRITSGGIVFAGFLLIALFVGLVAWLMPPDGRLHDNLLLVSQVSLLLGVAIPAQAFVAQWAASQPSFRVCSYCHTSVKETDGYECAGKRFACLECCATDVRATGLLREREVA